MAKQPNATRRQWIAVLGAVLGAFMAVLDISITNASLQDIEGALSAGIDEGSWIATSYLVAEIMVIPLTGWLSQVFSVRRYLLVNACLFLFFSTCCGLAWNLESMIAFRFLQGLTGGILIPMAASVIISTLPAHQRTTGLTLFGMVATFGPAIGPTIGGWLTINYGWQYIFYLNLVPGAILIGMVSYGLDEAPSKLELLKKGDWFGIGTMCAGLACLEVFLEEGNRKDWFGSELICWMFFSAVVSIGLFIYRQLSQKEPFINLRLLATRNFFLSAILSLSLGMGLYGSIYILPLYLGTIQRYDALQIGKVIMWVGLPQLFVSPFVPKILKKVDARLMIGIGVTIFALSCYLNSNISLDVAGPQLMITQIIRALGQPLIMVPLQIVAYSGIASRDVGSASGLFNMMRNLGGSVGIGLLSTLLTRRYQFHFSRLAERMSVIDPVAHARIAQMTQNFVNHSYSPNVAHNQALGVIYQTFTREANIMAFNDCFLFMAATLMVGACGLFFVKKVDSSHKDDATAGH